MIFFEDNLLDYSVISLTHSHTPFRFSFHKVTLPSEPETASTFPLKLQLTLHRTASPKSFSVVANCHELISVGFVLVHILTVLSCDAEAIYVFDSSVGDQATSRTQSEWPSGNDSIWVYVFCCWFHSQILTSLSEPPVTKRLLLVCCDGSALRAIAPGRPPDGDQETALTPMPCAEIRV